MISADSLGSLVTDSPSVCAWPECGADRPRGAVYCDKHRLRVARGAEPGIEGPWERLLVAALRIADAETDRQFERRAQELKQAAEGFKREKRRRVS